MPDILKPAVRYIDTAVKLALLNINHADYMRHIVSHFAAERMKHVKQYLGRFYQIIALAALYGANIRMMQE